ncbi:MAG: S-layer homology domain-containing protein [Chloroflexi bacterium]|nr:S-layer homology domain-containing protein [Chloroflexota bacterium]
MIYKALAHLWLSFDNRRLFIYSRYSHLLSRSPILLLFLLLTGSIYLLSTPTSGEASIQSPAPSAPSAPTPLFRQPSTAECGNGWTQVYCPSSGPNDNSFHGITTLSTSDVWAVGNFFLDTNYRHPQALIEHWDGTQWSIVPSPVLTDSTLYSVAAVSSSDVWAVGRYGPYGNTRTLTEHWNGSTWQVVPSPNTEPSDINALYSVAVITSDDVWAFGSFDRNSINKILVERWDGTQWSIMPVPNINIDTILFASVALGSNDIWVVGGDFTGTRNETFTMHWDGVQWSIVPSPSPGQTDNVFYGVTALASNDVWAAGYAFTTGGLPRTLIEHWDGSAWQVVPSPNMLNKGNTLEGMGAIAPDDVWAVGYSLQGSTLDYEPVVEHWDGTQWRIVALPPVEGGGALLGVSGVASTDVWAVGLTYAYPEVPLALHWNGAPCATPSPSPTSQPSVTGTPTSSSTTTATVISSTTTPTQPPDTTPSMTSTPTASATTCMVSFTDVPVGSAFYPYIECLACKGIVSGYDDGTFRPGNNVTRGQLAKIVANSASFQEDPGAQLYQDVPPGSTFYPYIERLTTRGVMSGYSCDAVPDEPCVAPGNLPYFRPYANATRGQISKIVVNTAVSLLVWVLANPADNTFEDVRSGSTFYQYIESAYAHNVLGGYPCGSLPAGECVPPGNKPYFLPGNNATRGQTSKVVGNTFFPSCSISPVRVGP